MNNTEHSNNRKQRLLTYELPNGLSIYHLNEHETDFLYREIFEERVYLKHGITLHDGDFVFDIGANIGLFSLFALQHCRNITLYAFEPSPQLCDILRENLAPYSAGATVLQYGLSDQNSAGVFKFYPHYSILSGFYAAEEDDGDTLKAGIHTLEKNAGAFENHYVDELIHAKLDHGEEYTCQLKTLSSVLRDVNIQRIDLLKIDVEKSELRVFNGIAEKDWPSIKQIVMEVHDSAEQHVLREITARLERYNFVVTVIHEAASEHANIFNIYGINRTWQEQPATCQHPQKTGPSQPVMLTQFLSELRHLGVTLWADGDRMRCKAPTGVLTPELRAQLRDRKSEILAFLHAGQKAAQSAPDPIPSAPRAGRVSASLIQQQLWFLYQLKGPTAVHNLSFGMQLKGCLNIAALEESIQTIVRRHDILRTTFDEEENQPLQIIHQNLTFPLQRKDLQHIPDSRRHAEVQRIVTQEARKPLDLKHGPLCRFILFRLGDQEHALQMIAHHSLFDFLSAPLFMSELSIAYTAFCEQRAPNLPELPVQYADFAFWQQQQLQHGRFEATLIYWQEQLADAPPFLDLPTDAPRPPTQTLSGATEFFDSAPTLAHALQRFASQEGVSLFMVCLAAFTTLLYRYSHQTDMLIGVPVSGRLRPEFDHLIGCFASQIVLRTTLADTLTFRELIQHVRDVELQAHAHQDVPFSKIIEVARPARNPQYHPLIQVMFNFLEQPDLQLSGLTLKPLSIANTLTEFDLFVNIVHSAEYMGGAVLYNSDIFHAETIRSIIESYHDIFDQCLQTPDIPLADMTLSPALRAQAERGGLRQQQQTIAITATFTAEPVQESLLFWAEKLQSPSRVEFAPYNQVFQQLLNPAGLLAKNERGVNIVLVRFEDWQQHDRSATLADAIRQNADDLISALHSSLEHAETPYILGLCPVSPSAGEELRTLSIRAEERLEAEFKDVRGIAVITPGELARLYPVEGFYNAQSDRLGHIPYTPEFFAALGTLLIRKSSAMTRTPYKVIVLDCDGTLWRGVCGEDGPLGIALDAPYLALQRFMAAQYKTGMLLCVCSKNNAEDVWAVFTQHRSDMPLTRGHLVTHRINWEPKSANILAIAEELQLGLDSFIFIDDNPVECAEVSSNCPGVLSVQLPPDAGTIPHFLDHFWAFDHSGATAEDTRRTEMYRENTQRERARRKSLTFQDFLNTLDLHVSISGMAPCQLPRVSQLTQRTNQFNLTTIRRSEAQLQTLCDTESYECFVTEVADRFGEYGLVGVMLVHSGADALRVETFLLSCRALGRGVEHQMLAYLGKLGLERGVKTVEVAYVPTPKNTPAHDFLRQVGAPFERPEEHGSVFSFPAAVAAELTYRPPQQTPRIRPSAPDTPPSAPSEPSRVAGVFSDIATRLTRPEDILQAIHRHNIRSRPSLKEQFAAPRTPVERLLAQILAEILELEQVGVHDNFFEIGGHSLLAVQYMTRIQKEFGRDLQLSVLLEHSTIASLAQLLQNMPENNREWSFLVPIQPQGLQPPLFCIHPGGGHVLAYYNLARHLGTDQPIYGIQAQGLEEGQEPLPLIEAMAAAYLDALKTVQPQGPYWLAGWSFGGFVAFEMARQLCAQHQTVAFLGLIDADSPVKSNHELRREIPDNDAEALIVMLGLDDISGFDEAELFSRLEPLDRDRQILSVLEQARQAYPIPQDVDVDAARRLVHVLRSEEKALQNYMFGPYSGKITYFQAQDRDLDTGWDDFTDQEIEQHVVPGNHHTIMLEPNIAVLAEQLQRCLTRVQTEEKSV